MKTMLLLLVGLALSAQRTIPEQGAFLATDYFTDGWLNGVWWEHATPMEREIYRRAWNEATGRKGRPLIWASIYKDLNIEPYVSVKEVIKILDNRVTAASPKTDDSPR
jgi:hypothetical protein